MGEGVYGKTLTVLYKNAPYFVKIIEKASLSDIYDVDQSVYDYFPFEFYDQKQYEEVVSVRKIFDNGVPYYKFDSEKIY